MRNFFFQFKSYITYWLDAVDEHSLHSPFFFNFYAQVVKAKERPVQIQKFEELREKLLGDNRYLNVMDLGAGSEHLKGPARRIRDIARTSLSTTKHSCLYWRIINTFKLGNIIELGTSLGVNTLFMAASPPATLITFEGSEEIASSAEDLFREAGLNNIKMVRGNIDLTLNSELNALKAVDFAFIDANHRREPTLRYFGLLISKAHEKSIFVFDDIHSSLEMENAWREIQRYDQVHATADLYRCGLVFFDPSLNKQHVVLRF